MSSSLNTKQMITTGLGIGAALLVTYYSARLLTKTRKRKITKVIETIQALQKDTVRMKDPQKVENLVCQLIKGGSEKLQVISDFDDTLTKTHVNGKRCANSYGVVEQTTHFPDVYRQKMKAAKDLYYPIEMDPKLTIEEKTPHMVEWWTISNTLLAQCHFTRVDLTQIVKDSTTKLRDGTFWFLKTLREHQIPLLIFSAGLGDVIEEIFMQHAELSSNMKIVSNFLDYDEGGKTCGFKGDLIHAFNKNITGAKSNIEYFKNLNSRSNIILVGDSLGDLGMIQGVVNAETVLKIGFLNTKVDENLSNYLDNFDVVLVDDQSMDVVNGVLQKIV